MFNKIRAVHIAVKNVEEAAKQYTDNFGITVSQSGTMPNLGIKNALIPIGDAVIELIEPINAEEGPIAQFLKNRGEGVYMVALEVPNLDAAIKSFKEKGVRLISDDPESRAQGIPVFIHPKSTRGLLVELVQASQ